MGFLKSLGRCLTLFLVPAEISMLRDSRVGLLLEFFFALFLFGEFPRVSMQTAAVNMYGSQHRDTRDGSW